MEAKATTVRLENNLQTALVKLSKFVHRPMNALINEAVESYLDKNTPIVEKEMESDLAALRAYRQRDPHYKSAMQSFVVAEVKHTDPLEGRVIRKVTRTATKTARSVHA